MLSLSLSGSNSVYCRREGVYPRCAAPFLQQAFMALNGSSLEVIAEKYWVGMSWFLSRSFGSYFSGEAYQGSSQRRGQV